MSSSTPQQFSSIPLPPIPDPVKPREKKSCGQDQNQNKCGAGHLRLTPVILATQKVEIRRIMV
jgi:hypothetical protein